MATPSHPSRSAHGTGDESHEKHPRCDLYVPGHLVHFIQAKMASRSERPVRWGRYGGIENGRLVVRFLDGSAGRYRIHRPEEVAGVAEVGDKVRVCEGLRYAAISRRFEHVLSVCIALTDDAWRPCSVASGEPATLEELTDRLEDRGGFLVSGRRLAELVDSRSEGGAAPPDGGLEPVS